MQNSEFVYFSSKSGKHMKQMSNPPFWGDFGVKNFLKVVSVWFLDSAARSLSKPFKVASPFVGLMKRGTNFVLQNL